MSEQPSKPVTWRRTALPRNGKSLRLVLRPRLFAKLQRLAATDGTGRREPIVAVVERLIEAA